MKELKKLGAQAQQQILSYLDSRIAGRTDDPRRFGKPLTGDLKGLWRYRVNDYRLICSVEGTQRRRHHHFWRSPIHGQLFSQNGVAWRQKVWPAFF